MKRKGFYLNYRKKRTILLIFTVILLIAVYLFKSSSFILRAGSTIAVMALFYAIDHFFDIRFGKRHYLFMFIIVIAGFLASPLYYIYPNYDKIQHFIQPMFICSLAFYLIKKLHLELKWKLVFTFLTVVAILGFFEIGEFTLDSLFHLKLQGVYLRDIGGLKKLNLVMNPLKDTMIDMLLGVMGAAIYCIIFGVSMKQKLNENIFREF